MARCRKKRTEQVDGYWQMRNGQPVWVHKHQRFRRKGKKG